MDKSLQEVVYIYLQEYAEAPLGSYPDPAPAAIASLRAQPTDAFAVIADYSGDRPSGLDPRDLGDPLCRLLARIADLVPDLLVARMSKGFWASRYLFISAAAASEDREFIPALVRLLGDRSIYVKNLVLQLVAQWPHLQVQEFGPVLEKLAGMKNYQNAYDRQILDRAREGVKKAT